MPIPKRRSEEKKSNFIARCMSDSVMNEEYPDSHQRYAICMSQSKGDDVSDSFDDINEGSIHLIEVPEIPSQENYIGKDGYEVSVSASQYVYRNPKTGEILFFSKRVNRKDLVFVRQTSAYEYGSCPICGSKIESRERRIDGNDKCINGHVFKSSSAICSIIGRIYIDRPFKTDFGYSVYILTDDLYRINFTGKKSEGSFQKTDPRYWSNKLGN